jgi:hypothetical protein
MTPKFVIHYVAYFSRRTATNQIVVEEGWNKKHERNKKV